MCEPRFVVAIDGPSGAGKSTVARMLAERLDLGYLDTGAMYRALALKALREGVRHDEGDKLGRIAASLDLVIRGDRSDLAVWLDGENVTDAIRDPAVAEVASAVSVHPQVRREIVAVQRRIISDGRWVLEGRDTTTVVAPNANLKIYLDATPEERARRRHKQLQERGIPTDFESVLRQQLVRDARDASREDSPLKCAEDAVRIDTTYLTAEEVVDRIASLVGELCE